MDTQVGGLPVLLIVMSECLLLVWMRFRDEWLICSCFFSTSVFEQMANWKDALTLRLLVSARDFLLSVLPLCLGSMGLDAMKMVLEDGQCSLFRSRCCVCVMGHGSLMLGETPESQSVAGRRG